MDEDLYAKQVETPQVFPKDKPEDILQRAVEAHEKNLDTAIQKLQHVVKTRHRHFITLPEAQALLDFIEGATGEIVSPDPDDPSGDVPHFKEGWTPGMSSGEPEDKDMPYPPKP